MTTVNIYGYDKMNKQVRVVGTTDCAAEDLREILNNPVDTVRSNVEPKDAKRICRALVSITVPRRLLNQPETA